MTVFPRALNTVIFIELLLCFFCRFNFPGVVDLFVERDIANDPSCVPVKSHIQHWVALPPDATEGNK